MQVSEALQVLKQVMDASCKAGMFQDIDSAVTAANAYNTIVSAVQPAEPEKPAE